MVLDITEVQLHELFVERVRPECVKSSGCGLMDAVVEIIHQNGIAASCKYNLEYLQYHSTCPRAHVGIRDRTSWRDARYDEVVNPFGELGSVTALRVHHGVLTGREPRGGQGLAQVRGVEFGVPGRGHGVRQDDGYVALAEGGQGLQRGHRVEGPVELAY